MARYPLAPFHYRTINVLFQEWFALNRLFGYSFGFIRCCSFIPYPVWWAFYFGFEWSIWRLIAFLHFLMQLARCSFHMNYTIEQFRWYYVLDHVLAFQLWYIQPPSVTRLEWWSVYDTDVFDPSGFIGVWSLSSGKAQSTDGSGRYVFVLCLLSYVYSLGGNAIISDRMFCTVATSPRWHVILSSASQCVRYHALSHHGAWRKDKRDIEITDEPCVCCSIRLHCHSIRWIPCSWMRCVRISIWKCPKGTHILCRIHFMIFVFEDKT